MNPLTPRALFAVAPRGSPMPLANDATSRSPLVLGSHMLLGEHAHTYGAPFAGANAPVGRSSPDVRRSHVRGEPQCLQPDENFTAMGS